MISPSRFVPASGEAGGDGILMASTPRAAVALLADAVVVTRAGARAQQVFLSNLGDVGLLVRAWCCSRFLFFFNPPHKAVSPGCGPGDGDAMCYFR